MESDKLYKIVFYVGCSWNFIIAAALLVTTPTLHTMVGIAAPLYPMFIYFNLMSIFSFGCIQWIIARNLYGHRSFVKLLAFAKFAMVVLFIYSILIDVPPKELVLFLLPGMIVDTVFGFAFWRFLVFSRPKAAS